MAQEFLQDTGQVAFDPARGLPFPKAARALPTCLTEQQAKRPLEAAHTPWHRAMVALLLFAGLRRSEVTAISFEDLDLPARSGTSGQLLVHAKGAKQRVVPLTPTVVQAIREYLRCRPESQSTHLFVSRIGAIPSRGASPTGC